MPDQTPKTPDQNDAEQPTFKPQPDQDSEALEEAQAEAAEEREDEGGYQ
jgi:hypothetical protein